MKKLITVLAIAFSFSGMSQTVNGTPIPMIPATYIKVVATNKSVFKPFQVNVYVDYGQISSMRDIKKGWILDSNGQPMTFNGAMGCVNYLVNMGWTLEETLLMTYGNTQSHHFIFKRN